MENGLTASVRLEHNPTLRIEKEHMMITRLLISLVMAVVLAQVASVSVHARSEGQSRREDRKEQKRIEEREKRDRERKRQKREEEAERYLLDELEKLARKNGKEFSGEQLRESMAAAARKGEKAYRKQLKQLYGSKTVSLIVPAQLGKNLLEKAIKKAFGKAIENPIGLDPQEVDGKGKRPRDFTDREKDPKRRYPRDSTEEGDLNWHVTAMNGGTSPSRVFVQRVK